MANEFGEYMKVKRLELGKTLREFCKENGLDPVHISRIERGIEPPPELDEMETLAWCLGLYHDHKAQALFLKLAENGRREFVKPCIATVSIWPNGMVFATDAKGKEVELCMGFILTVADNLKEYCDENTTWLFGEYSPDKKRQELRFSWWWKEGYDADPND